MSTYDNSYSRFIAFAKVVLPLVALGILATLFLFSKSVDPQTTIPFSDVDVSEIARDQRIGAPNYAGVTDDGSAISITAKSAQPDAQDSTVVTAELLSAVIDDLSGGQIDVVSKSGRIDSTNQQAAMMGDVVINTSTGYKITTDGVVIALDKTDVKTTGPITADGPMGHLEAGGMSLQQTEQTNNHKVLHFHSGVKLIYTP